MKANPSHLYSRSTIQRVLKEKLRNPALSCRKLSTLLKNKYDITLSKTAVHILLKENNVREVAGRKKEEMAYQKMTSPYAGLFILKAADEILHFSTRLAENIAEKLPSDIADAPRIKAYFDYLLYASFLYPDQTPANASSLPHLNLVYTLAEISSLSFSCELLQKITRHLKDHPIHLAADKRIHDCFKPLSVLKLTAGDGTLLFVDPHCIQFTGPEPSGYRYFSNASTMVKRIDSMIADSCLMLLNIPTKTGFTAAFLRAFRACQQGIAHIEALDKDAATVYHRMLSPNSMRDCIIGFNPAVFKKSLRVTSPIRKERLSFPGFPDECYLYDFECLILQNAVSEKVPARIVLMQKLSQSHSYWGIMTTIKRQSCSAKDLTRRFLSIWLNPAECVAVHDSYGQNSGETLDPMMVQPGASLLLSQPSDIQAVLAMLKEFTQTLFALGEPWQDTKIALDELLTTKGYIVSGKKIVMINLIPENPARRSCLKMLSQRITQENLLFQGKRLIVSVVEK